MLLCRYVIYFLLFTYILLFVDVILFSLFHSHYPSSLLHVGSFFRLICLSRRNFYLSISMCNDRRLKICLYLSPHEHYTNHGAYRLRKLETEVDFFTFKAYYQNRDRI